MGLATKANLQKAADHLRRDPVLAPIINRVGLATFEPHTNYYSALTNSIIGQQVSVQSAAAVKRRLQELFDGHFPSPEEILSVDAEQLRNVGFSRQKAGYVHDLAQHIVDGRVTFDRIASQSDEEIIAELTDVKGIGVWTVHMFLMFCVGRLNVLPVGDLGVRNGIRNLYSFENTPTPDEVATVAQKNNWHPYMSVASWYVWRSFDNDPKL